MGAKIKVVKKETAEEKKPTPEECPRSCYPRCEERHPGCCMTEAEWQGVRSEARAARYIRVRLLEARW
jgi:hypothetical protein